MAKNEDNIESKDVHCFVLCFMLIFSFFLGKVFNRSVRAHRIFSLVSVKRRWREWRRTARSVRTRRTLGPWRAPPPSTRQGWRHRARAAPREWPCRECAAESPWRACRFRCCCRVGAASRRASDSHSSNTPHFQSSCSSARSRSSRPHFQRRCAATRRRLWRSRTCLTSREWAAARARSGSRQARARACTERAQAAWRRRGGWAWADAAPCRSGGSTTPALTSSPKRPTFPWWSWRRWLQAQQHDVMRTQAPAPATNSCAAWSRMFVEYCPWWPVERRRRRAAQWFRAKPSRRSPEEARRRPARWSWRRWRERWCWPRSSWLCGASTAWTSLLRSTDSEGECLPVRILCLLRCPPTPIARSARTPSEHEK